MGATIQVLECGIMIRHPVCQWSSRDDPGPGGAQVPLDGASVNGRGNFDFNFHVTVLSTAAGRYDRFQPRSTVKLE